LVPIIKLKRNRQQRFEEVIVHIPAFPEFHFAAKI
jgi:hypothetical protein